MSVTPSQSALSVEKLVKRYGQALVLDHVSLRVAEREVVALIGPSGSGKSTLVRCIHQLVPIEGGAVYVHGELQGFERTDSGLRALGHRAIAAQRQRIGMVFQQFNLFPHMSVLRNVMEGPVQVLGENPETARRPMPSSCSTAWACSPRRTPTRASCRATSSSAWRLRGPWPCGPRPCCSTAHQRAGP